MHTARHWRKIILLSAFLSLLFRGTELKAQCENIDFTANFKKGCLPFLVRFTATGVPSGSLLYWDWGNGPIAGSETMFENFTQSGIYDVTLKVKLPDGTECVKTKKNFLDFSALAKPVFGAALTQACGTSYAFTVTDSTPGVTRREWYIDGKLSGITSPNLLVTLWNNSSASIGLKIYNASGCSHFLLKENYLHVDRPPAPRFRMVMYEDGATGKTKARFRIAMDTAGLYVSSYSWEFSGGTPATYIGAIPPDVSYPDLSTAYDVKLTVTTKAGCVSSQLRRQLVRSYYSIPKRVWCQNENIPFQYKLQRSGPDSLLHISSDNEVVNVKKTGIAKYTVSFFRGGPVKARLILPVNVEPYADTLHITNLVRLLPSRADFVIDGRRQCKTPATVKLQPIFTSPDTGINTYTYYIYDSLGNQISGSPIGPTIQSEGKFTLTKKGQYSAKVAVSNSVGCRDTVYMPKSIHMETPEIDVRILNDSLCAGEKLLIENHSFPDDNPDDPYQHRWLLKTPAGSGYLKLTSLERVPNFTMPAPGIYDLSYTIISGNCYDSVVMNKSITVSGFNATFGATQKLGCAPFTTSLGINMINKVTSAQPNEIKYKWEAIPASGIVFSDSTSPMPTVTVLKNGSYKIRLTIKAPNTCTYVKEVSNVIIGGTVARFQMPDTTCLNTNVSITDNSLYSPDVREWSVSPEDGAELYSLFDPLHPTLRITKPGLYEVRLRTGRNGETSCNDTIIKQIRALKPNALFTVADTERWCAPVTISFTNVAIDSLHTYTWLPGDGSVVQSQDSIFEYTYQYNRNEGYRPRLIATNAFGCSDTFTLGNKIHIYGPMPGFEPDQKYGCDSLDVNFQNTSQNVRRFYMMYGDNSPIDSGIIRPHRYVFRDFSLDSNVFYPTIFGTDDSSCLSVVRDTITLYRPVQPNISLVNKKFCVGIMMRLNNKSLYVDNYLWNWGDGTFDSTPVTQHLYTRPGKYVPRVMLSTKKGCTREIVLDTVTVYGKPEANFEVLNPDVCFGDTVHFRATGTGDAPTTRWRWDFGDPKVTSDTSSATNPVYRYAQPGKYNVRLTVFTANGCTDVKLITNAAYVRDTVNSAVPRIHYITVEDTHSVKIAFSRSRESDFSGYRLMRTDAGGPPMTVFETTDINDTVFYYTSNVNTNSRSYAFSLLERDSCMKFSQSSTRQASILLTLSSPRQQYNQLHWNPYEGWDTPASYRLFRKEGNGSYVLLATLNDTAYADSGLCDKEFTYYVEAVHSGIYTSISNKVKGRPMYYYAADGVELRTVTVTSGGRIRLLWSPAMQTNLKFYAIDRYTPGEGWQNDVGQTTQTWWEDPNADPNTTQYMYRLRLYDNCGYVSPYGNTSGNILLIGTIEDDARVLRWNQYREWKQGVQSYMVQRINNAGDFISVAIRAPQDTTISDDSAHNYLRRQVCYRIMAIEDPNSMEPDTSISNTVCPVIPSRLFIPSAFTPNIDNLNEEFKPIGMAIWFDYPGLEYSFKIFNRWGERIFETNDPVRGWDGSVSNAPAAAGVYTYLIEAHGQDGKSFYRKGTFHLIR